MLSIRPLFLFLSLASLAGILAAQTTSPTAAEPPVTIDELVVTATRAAVTSAEAPTRIQVIDAALLEQRHTLRLGDAIADTPGLYLRGSAFGPTTPGSGLGGISLRGISNSRTLVLVDGQAINSSYSSAVNWSAIPLDDVARIEVVPGAFSSLYGGNAMGGVIHVLTRTPERREFSARAGTGGGAGAQWAASFVYRDTPVRGFAYSLGAGYRRNDSYINDYVIKSPTAGTAVGGIPISGAVPTLSAAGAPSYNIGDKGKRPWDQRDGFAKFHFAVSPGAQLVIGYAYDRFDTRYTPFTTYLRNAAGQPVTSGTVTFNDPVAQRFSVSESDFLVLQPSAEENRRAHANFEQLFANKSRLLLTASHTRFGTYFVSPRTGVATYDRGPGTFSDSPSTRADFDANFTVPVTSAHELIAGLAYQKNDLHRENSDLAVWRDPRGKLSEYYDSSGTARTWGLYAQDRIALSPALTLYLGGRFTWWETSGRATQSATALQPSLVASSSVYPSRRESQFSPKASMVWRAQPALTLRASAGTAFRTPTLLDLYVPSYIAKTGPVGIRITEADPNLQPETLRTAELGADLALRPGTRFALTGYVNDLRDLVYQKTIITGTANDLNRNINAGAARILGLESSIRQALGARFQFIGSVGYTDTEIRKNDISPATVGKRLGDVPLLTSAAGLTWSWQRFTADANVRYTSHVYTRSDELNANVVNGVFGAYDTYAVVNVKLGAALTPQLRASLAFDNLLDRTYHAFYRQPGRTWYAELVTKY